MYFSSANDEGCNTKNSITTVYSSLPSDIRPAPYGFQKSNLFLLFQRIRQKTADTDIYQSEDHFTAHRFSKSALYDLGSDFNLPKQSAGIFASRLKKKQNFQKQETLLPMVQTRRKKTSSFFLTQIFLGLVQQHKRVNTLL